MSDDFVTVVTGLPRSGTSMMMKMLESGGIPVLVDHIRTADEDNPKGYYEFERVKQIETDQAWLAEAGGKAVKMVAALLKHLPTNYRYRVVFMQRNISEVLASQRAMLRRRGEPADDLSDEKMADMFARHVEKIQAWLAQQHNMQVLYVHYADVIAHPAEQVGRINEFLGGTLDAARMQQTVDSQLYRQRSGASG
ncbi:MAG TPA: sulfotransferase [Anaerolineae bacterium]|nr:sulfotransferase [Anaerolineae bacterium]